MYIYELYIRNENGVAFGVSSKKANQLTRLEILIVVNINMGGQPTNGNSSSDNAKVTLCQYR